jgi:hypothetical protein
VRISFFTVLVVGLLLIPRQEPPPEPEPPIYIDKFQLTIIPHGPLSEEERETLRRLSQPREWRNPNGDPGDRY